MQFEKQMKIIILTIAILTFFSCGESEFQKKEKNGLAKIQENESKFYYPESHDKWWRVYEPNLIGAEGWIISDCNGQKYPNDRVTVAQINLAHKSWGRYEGTLLVGNLKKGESFEIDFKCFKPDFEKGSWLNNSN